MAREEKEAMESRMIFNCIYQLLLDRFNRGKLDLLIGFDGQWDEIFAFLTANPWLLGLVDEVHINDRSFIRSYAEAAFDKIVREKILTVGSEVLE